MGDADCPTNAVRAKYSEYFDGPVKMALISDPSDGRAWILSSVSVPVEP